VSLSSALPLPLSADEPAPRPRPRWAIWRSPADQPAWARPALLGIAAVAALLYARNIAQAGLAPFYSVAVKSMSVSWKAFFYGAFDPGATITIDKLAGSFLPQALSARIFGFHPWSLALPRRARIQGVDMNSWALGEAEWTWRHFGLEGRARRGDLVSAVEALRERRGDRLDRTGVIAAWSVNELPRPSQDRLLPALLELGRRGACILLVEPLSHLATPWWGLWESAFLAAGGRADEWKFAVEFPRHLAALDEAAGFQREGLGGKTLAIINGAMRQ